MALPEPRDDDFQGDEGGLVNGDIAYSSSHLEYHLEVYPFTPTADSPLVASPAVSEVSFVDGPFFPALSIHLYDMKTKRVLNSTLTMNLGLVSTSKFCIPGSAIKPDIDRGIQLTEVTPESLVEQGFWTAERLADATGKAGKPKKMYIDEEDHVYLLKVQFTREGCRAEGLFNVDSSSTGYNLKQEILKGGDIFLNMIIIAGGIVKDDYINMIKVFKEHAKNDLGPLKTYYPLSIVTPPTFAEPAVHSFHSMNHYGTVIYIAFKQNDQYVKKLGAPKAFISREFVLFTMDGHGTRQYLLVIQDAQSNHPETSQSEIEDASGLRQFQPGDHIFVDFKDKNIGKRKSNEGKRWNGHVIDSSTILQPNATLLAIISRPWDSTTNSYTDVVDYPAKRWEDQVDVERFNRMLQSAKPVPGFIHKAYSERRWKNFRAALETWSEKDVTETTTDVANLLVNSCPDLLPLRDLFQSVRPEFADGDVTACMKLSEDQGLAIEAARRAPGGLTLIQGPPGTGKSHLGVQLIIPFLRSPSRFRIIFSHSSIDGVDTLARAIDKTIKELQKKGFASEKRIVIAHSPQSVADVYFNKPKAQRGCKPNTRPGAVQPFAIGEEDVLGQCDVAQRLVQDLQIGPDGPQIRDPRLKAFNLSLSYNILSYLDIIPFGPRSRDDTKKKHLEDISAQYRKYSGRSKKLTQDELVKLRASLQDVRNWVLADADVVVSTLTTAGSPWLFSSIPSPELILVDDAAKVFEPDLFPIFSIYITKHRILIGDIMQIRPVVKSLDLKRTDPGRNFAVQLSRSFMYRLQQTGFPVTRLRTHFRSVPDILGVYNDVLYDGRLQAAPSTAVETRPIAQAVADFNSRKYQKASNVIFFDVPSCKQLKSESMSSFNEGLACAALNFLEGLCQDEEIMALNPSIMVMTAYQAQHNLYKTALQALALAHPSAQFIFANKAETFQGIAVDICLVDWVVTDMPGFMNDLNRLNVMHSRANHGLYVFANKRSILQTSRRQGKWLHQFVKSLAKFQVQIGTSKTIQKSKWYSKGDQS